MVDFNKLRNRTDEEREQASLTFAEKEMQRREEEDLKILSVIGSTEPSTFFEFCNGLRRLNICPEKGDKAGWKQLFVKINEFGADGLIKQWKSGNNIEKIQLTKEGADKVRDFADASRELFQVEDRDYTDDDSVPWEV